MHWAVLGACATGMDINGPSIEDLPACVEGDVKKIISGEYAHHITAFKKK